MKQSKGTVGVENNNGRLRLRLPRQLFGGKQTYLYLGLADTKANRKIASAKAGMIEADIIFEKFDFTLEKYKSPTQKKPEKTEIELRNLWHQYTEFKSISLASSSLKDFKRIANHIEEFPSQALDKAKLIAKFCRENYSLDTTRRIIMQLNACCEWAVAEELIEVNIFKNLGQWLKPTIPRTISPFQAGEIAMIQHAFKTMPEHQHYERLVRFFFLTGCRTSEAVALQWQHISADLEYIYFQDAVVDGVRGRTKNKKSRQFPVNGTLVIMLEFLKKQKDHEPSDPVFTDTKGNLVRPNNFLRRHWQPVVRSLKMPYRPQYNTRHTFITNCLQAGVPVAQVAAWVGNSPRVIWEHYAGFMPSEVPAFKSL